MTTIGSGQSSGGLTVTSGDSLTVVAGGTITGTVVNSGGTIVNSGLAIGTSAGTAANLGGTVIEFGVASQTVVFRAGEEVVSSGGLAVGTTIEFAALALVSGGGTITNAVLTGTAATMNVFPGGVAISTTLLSGTTQQIIFSGGTALATQVVNGGAVTAQFGAVISGAIVGSGGILGVQQTHGTADIVSGGIEVVTGAGTELGGLVEAGGSLTVLSQGTLVAPTLGANGTIDLNVGAVVSGGITFAGSGAILKAEALPGSAVALRGFAAGQTIDLVSTTFSGGAQANVLGNGDLGLIVGGSTTDLGFAPATAGGSYVAVSDGSAGTNILAAACFAAGTRIRTARGDVPVEHLVPGDRVVTPRDGGLRDIVWLGRRSVDCARHPRPRDVQPVRIEAGAIAPGQPQADLWLSPDHALYLDDMLIPVRHLLNGATIAQIPLARVTYFHVELARHDVLLAEGVPAETYLDTGNRAAFENGGDALALHPDFARRIWQARGCAPLLADGNVPVAIRRALYARAGVLGHTVSRAALLRFNTDRGRPAVTRSAGRLHVALPEGARRLTLRSRRYVPAQHDATAIDHRVLGVALGQLWLDDGPVPLDDPRLCEGWHDVEPDALRPGWRWSDGGGVIDCSGHRQATLAISLSGIYWVAPVRRAATTAPARMRAGQRAGQFV